jgi:hypothetical protein
VNKIPGPVGKRHVDLVVAAVGLYILVLLATTILKWSWIQENSGGALFLATLSLVLPTVLLFWATYKVARDAINLRQSDLERIDGGVIDQLCNLLKSVEQRMTLAEKYAAHPLKGDDWLFSRLLERVFSADAAVALRAAAPGASKKTYRAVRTTQTAIAAIESERAKYYEGVDSLRKTLAALEAGDDSAVKTGPLGMPLPGNEKIKAAAAAAIDALRDARTALGDTTAVDDTFRTTRDADA